MKIRNALPALAVLAFCILLPSHSSAQGGGGQTIYCASDDGRRNWCNADTRGGVQLVRQRSDAACTYGSTWGYEERGIWVDRGCRADFQVNPWNPGEPPGTTQGSTLYCASDDGRRNWCPAETRGGVQLLRQRSNAACTYGSTWGYEWRGIWVDRGCRADFQINPWSPPPEPGPESLLYCASDDGRRHWCEADARGGAQLVRRRSNADCIFGATWGYDDRGIWVDRGCRADFRVGSAGWYPGTESYSIYCASDDGRRHECSTDTGGGVRLVRRRSDAECDYGRTWGYTQRGVWVDRGCRADFEIGGSDWDPVNRGYTVIYCASDDMERHSCAANTRRGVRLIRQRSNADCIQGVTWGFNRREIWVDRGCRADFQVGSFR